MSIRLAATLLYLIVFCAACSIGTRVQCNRGEAPAQSLQEFAARLDPGKRAALEDKVNEIVLQRTLGNLGTLAGMALSGNEEGMSNRLQKDVFRDFCGRTYNQIMEMD